MPENSKTKNNWSLKQKIGEFMKIIWSDFASEALKDIYQYHKNVDFCQNQVKYYKLPE